MKIIIISLFFGFLSIAAQAEDLAQMKNLKTPTPELIAKGKEIYSVQCLVCHGVVGRGDGAAAAAMKPPPRNFTSGEWKYGGGPLAVFNTITKGSKGTSMVGFGHLGVEDRWGLAHFVRSLSPNPPQDKPEDWALLEENGGAEEKREEAEKSRGKTSIAFAVKQLSLTLPSPADALIVAEGMEATTLGGRLYQTKCMQCHGVRGGGGIPVKLISTNPAVYFKTRSFQSSAGEWKQGRPQFVDIVSKGNPGQGKPGIAHLTDNEWDALYQYTKELSQSTE